MVVEYPDILFYIGENFLTKYDLTRVSLVSKYFCKTTRVPKLSYIGHNIISKLDIEISEITPFFNYLRENRHDFQFNITSDYRTLELQLDQDYSETDYHVTNHLINMILNYFFYADKTELISLTETSKTCLERGILTRVDHCTLDYCRLTLIKKDQIFRHRFKNLLKRLSIRELRYRQESFRKKFRNCYAIII